MITTSSGHTVARRLRAGALVGALLASAALSASARAQMPDSRFQPWLGCWVSSSAPLFGAPTDGPDGMVCVIPAQTGNGVNVVSVLNGKIIRSEALVASGERTPRSLENCPGWQTAVWSKDNHRLLLRSEYACGSITTVKGSGVMSMSSTGEWIQVEGTAVGKNATTAAIHYHAAGLELELTPGQVLKDSMAVTTKAVASTFAMRSMRMLAGEPVQTDDVLDVAKHVDAPVAEAWMTELNQRFDLNGKMLVALADAGMPSSMIDLMVALSYPQRYAVKRNEGDSANGNRAYANGRGDYARPFGYGMLSPFGCSYSAYDDPWYGGYDYGYGYGYGYNRLSSRGYGCGGGRGYFPSVYYGGYRPVVIVSRSDESARATGHAVNGRGYTRDSGPTQSNRSARPEGYTGSGSSTQSANPKTSGSSSSGSTSTGSGSTSSGSSGDGGRTAKARPPG